MNRAKGLEVLFLHTMTRRFLAMLTCVAAAAACAPTDVATLVLEAPDAAPTDAEGSPDSGVFDAADRRDATPEVTLDSGARDVGVRDAREPIPECELQSRRVAPKEPWASLCPAEVVVFERDNSLHKLHAAPEIAKRFSPRQAQEFLTMADVVWTRMQDTYGWSFTPPLGFDHYVCSLTGGAGAGVDGTGWSTSNFGFNSWTDGANAERNTWSRLVREMTHLWDFRSQLYLQGPDTALAFTAGMAPWINQTFGFEHLTGEIPTPANVAFYAWYRLSLERYFSRADLDWSHLYSEESLADAVARWPRDAERETVQGGLLLWLMRVHGPQAMRGFWNQIEIGRLLGREPQHGLERNGWLHTYLSRGLGLEAMPYLTRWKFPETRRSPDESYPESFALADNDRDGQSPLFGDFDDSDPTVYLDAPELPDGKDNDLDGLIDNLRLVETTDFPAEPRVARRLPVRWSGTLSDDLDDDGLWFELPEASWVSVWIRTRGGESTRLISRREVSALSAGIWLNNERFTGATHLSYGLGGRSTWLPAGRHLLIVRVNSPSFENSGGYEVLVFVNDFRPEPTAGPCADYAPKAYHNVPRDPEFDCQTSKDVPVDECEALKDLYNAAGTWAPAVGWLSTPDVCYWQGIFCGVNNRVDMLDLADVAMPDFDYSRFQRLRRLRATRFGPVPESLKNLNYLEQIDLRLTPCAPDQATVDWWSTIPERRPIDLPLCP